MTLETAVQAAATRIIEVLPNLKVLDAHGLLVALYSDENMPISIRLEAARAALRVEKPSLAATALTGELTLQAGVADRLGAARQRLDALSSARETIEALVVEEVSVK